MENGGKEKWKAKEKMVTQDVEDVRVMQVGRRWEKVKSKEK
jgi:hypothetical protein